MGVAFRLSHLSSMRATPRTRRKVACSVEVHIIKSANNPTGLGDPMLPPVVSALVNALYAATWKRVRALPLSKADLKWG